MALIKFRELKRNEVCRRLGIDIWGDFRLLQGCNSRGFRKFYGRSRRRFRSRTFMFRLDSTRPAKPRRHQSMYGLGMLAKQNFKHFLGNIPEKHFRRFFAQIRRYRSERYHSLVRNIESRLLSVIMRSGFFRTPFQIKQLILHGHVFVNSLQVRDYYFRINIGDSIHFSNLGKSIVKKRMVRKKVNAGFIQPPAQHLEVSYNIFRIVLARVPMPEHVKYPFGLDPFKLLTFYKV